jgi:hypothetical protein
MTASTMTPAQVIELMQRKANEAAARKNGPDPSPPPCTQDAEPERTILDEVYDLISRYVSATPAQIVTMMAYAFGTYVTKLFPAYGRMVWTSDGSKSKGEAGKSTAMEITASLSCNPMDIDGSRDSVRSALAAADEESESGIPTLYIDELTSITGESGLNGAQHPILNLWKKGFNTGQTQSWSVNRTRRTINISTPILGTGVGTVLTGQARSRTIMIHMVPGKPSEEFTTRSGKPKAQEWAKVIKAAVLSRQAEIASFRAGTLHPKLTGRKLDVWEPLLAVLYALGGQPWLNKGMDAFREVALGGETVVLSPVQRILRDASELGPEVSVQTTAGPFTPGRLLRDALRRTKPYLEQEPVEVSKDLVAAMGGKGVQKRTSIGVVRGYYLKEILAAWAAVCPPEMEDTEFEREIDPFDDVTDVTGTDSE